MWPSWVIFDTNFRQQAAELGKKDWENLDPSMYADCFNGQAKNQNAWCPNCHSLDHTMDQCPLQPPPSKRPKAGLSNRLPKNAQPVKHPSTKQEYCIAYNKHGKCKYGKRCGHINRCSQCDGPHPAHSCSTKRPEAPSPLPRTE